MTSVLITGATGFLGREVVRSLLSAHPEVQLVALIRAADPAELDRRLSRLRATLPEDQRPRLDAIQGDIEVPGFGLSARDHADLAARIDRVIHVAATVSFDHPLQEARLINVGGTQSVLDLCHLIRKRGGTGRLDYVGTAYVAGTRTDLCREDELDMGQRFRNTYEQSKFEAELLCRQAQGALPVAIYRPSIIVGDSRTGETTSYKTIYWPMKVLVRFYGLSRPLLPRLVRLPVNPRCLLDIVPVDFVADAVVRLYADDSAAGRCFHLAAGEGAVEIEALVNHCCDHFGVARLRYLSPTGPVARAASLLGPLVSAARPRLAKNLQLMHAYTVENPRFDVTQARAAGLHPPAVADYFTRLISYAYGMDFGRA